MKKLLSILLAISILLCTGLFTVSAENIEDKDDSRIDIGEIFGYYYDVTFIDGDNVSTAEFEENTEIDYPALTPERGCDRVWSLSENEYSPVPAFMPDEDITVYAYTLPYVGFENYPEEYTSDTVGVSTDYAYNDGGAKSLKYLNQSEAEDRKNSIALGNITADVAYKISFKYYVPTALNTAYYVDPFTGALNIEAEGNETDGMRVDYTASRFTINEDTKTGEWLDGTVYFTADEKAIGSYNYVYLWLKASESNNGDTVYFDHITTEEMLTADFIINDSVVVNSTNGVLNNNVFTAYYKQDEEITAPDATTKDGTPVVWIDASGNIVSEFVAGGVYSLKLDLKGDLNMDGAVSTTDLAIMKLYLVEAVNITELNVTNADINLNGKVDITDLAYLKLYLAGVVEQL